MSKAKPAPAGTQPGTPNMDNPLEVCVGCPECHKLRWLYAPSHGGARSKLKAKGFKKPCQSCAVAAWHRRTEEPKSALKTQPVPLLNGAMVRPGDRKEIHFRENTTPADCPICDIEHDICATGIIKGSRRKESAETGVCDGCKPWAVLALTDEQLATEGAEREAAYDKIKKLRELFEGHSPVARGGMLMPFSALAKRWLDTNQRENHNSHSNHFYEVRHLTLFFDDMPAGEVDEVQALSFRDYFLSRPDRRGKRTEATANQVMGCLLEMYTFAERRGWVRPNPFAAAVLTFKSPPLKYDRLVTVEEEGKLLAACVGRLADLRAPLICLADTGMLDKELRELTWADVNLDGDILSVRGRQVVMTRRLREELRALRVADVPPSEEHVFGRYFTHKLSEVCAAAGLDGIVVSHFRHTFAVRMWLAGRRPEKIAAALGLASIDKLMKRLGSSPEAAEQERNSPGFIKLMQEQFNVPAQTQNGDAQNKAGEEKPSRGGARNVKWTPELRAQLLTTYEAILPKLKKKDSSLPADVLHKASLRGNKPSDVALEYAAARLNMESNEYLRRNVLTEARREREVKTMDIQNET